MTIHNVPLSSLQPPAANPRTTFDAGALDGLAASILSDGLLQNLVVAPANRRGGKGGYRIISGERRFRALRLLQERGLIDGDFAVPVEVRDGLSKDDVLRIATIENLQREDLPPLDQAAALAALIRKGTTLDDLVARTGLSAGTVKRRLALNALCDEARAALVEGWLTLAQAEALTLGRAGDQRDLLIDLCARREMDADDIRAHFLDGRPTVAMAIFPREAYTGTVTTDLFGEAGDSYFDDVEQFMALQQEAVDAMARGYADTVDFVDITHHHRPPTWQYDEPAEGDATGILINLAPNGHVTVHCGLAKPQDMDESTACETVDAPDVAPARKASYPTPLRRLIAWHKTVAVQELLLSNPRKAREVLAVDLLLRLRSHEAVRRLADHHEPQAPFAAIDAQAALAAKHLGIEASDGGGFRTLCRDRIDDVEAYRAITALSDAQLDQLVTLLSILPFGQDNCDRLDSGESLFNAVAIDLGADMKHHWRPDADFLGRRTRDQLLAIAGACGFSEGRSALHTWKKAELVSGLLRHFEQSRSAADPTDAQLKARSWLPEAMLFPAVDPDAAAGEPSGDDDIAEDENEAA